MAPQNSTLLHGNSELVKGFGLYSPIARNRCNDSADHDDDDDDNSSSYSVTTDVHDVIDPMKKSIAEFRRTLDVDEVCRQFFFCCILLLLIGNADQRNLVRVVYNR